MKVLITGGAGFIGSHLAEECLERGDDVYIIDDLSTGSIDNIQFLQDDERFKDRLFVHIDSILNHGDRFMVLADFESYSNMQKKIEDEFRNTDLWTRKSITNSARSGKFSSDRTIREYARDIWNVKPARVSAEK